MVAHRYAIETDSVNWWAHSESHGWVVLDRSLPCNRFTTLPEQLRFTRCRDGKEYLQGDQPWNYREATQYLDSLPADQAYEAEEKLLELMEAFAA